MTRPVSLLFAMALAATTGLSACSSPWQHRDPFIPDHSAVPVFVEHGKIIGARTIELPKTQTGSRLEGGALGAGIGAAIGASIGHGNGRLTNAGIGGLIGGGLGVLFSDHPSRHYTAQWTIRLDDGRTIRVDQSGSALAVGRYVDVVHDHGFLRLMPRSAFDKPIN